MPARGSEFYRQLPITRTPGTVTRTTPILVEVTVTDPSGLTDTKTFTITVNDVSTHVAITNTVIDENDAGAIIGTLSAAIDDINATHEYTYTLSGTDAGSFEVVAGQLKLKDGIAANYEVQNSYSVTVTATDTGGLSTSQDFTVTINDINDDPTLANAIADQSVDEDSALSFTVPADTFNDEDGDTLTYTATLSDSSALPSWLSFDASTQTFSGTPVNADVGDITVQVTASDGSTSVSDTFTLTVANTNDAPTLANAIADQNVDEDSALSFTIPADTFNDIDVGDSLTYTATLSDSSALPSWLSFDASTQTFSGTPVNADVGTITVKVTATDGSSATISDTFTITVANTNDAPTAIALSSIGVPEKIDGAVVGTLTTTDVDVGDTHTYTVSDDRFEVVGGQLKLKAGNTVEYATEATITLTVTTTDAAGATFDQEFTLTVGSIQISATTFAENLAGAVVGDLSITDPDFTANVTYTLSGTDAASFEVVNGQLKLKDSVSADFETKNTYSITITATDDANHEASLTYSLQVTDANDAPTTIALSASVFDENTAGAVVGTLSTSDVDAGDTHTYELSGTDAESFEIINGQLKLKDSVTADYETQSSYLVTVTTTDSGGLTTTQSFTVTVNNTNDAPTLANALADQSVDEDSAFSFTVPANTFNDVDGDTLTYTATLSDGSALPTWLSFDAATQTFSGTPLNGDVGSINVQVTAIDAAEVAISDTFAIAVANTNDAPSNITLTANTPTSGTFSVALPDGHSGGFYIDGSQKPVLQVVAGGTYVFDQSDSSNQGHALGLSSLGGTGSELLANIEYYIDGNEVSATVYYNEFHDYYGEHPSSAEIRITIPQGITTLYYFCREHANLGATLVVKSQADELLLIENDPGAVVGTLGSTDVDVGDSVTYTLSGSHAEYFEVVSGQVKLKDGISVDYEANNTLAITVTATDSGGLYTSQSFTITVADINDAPNAIALSADSIQDGLAGATVGEVLVTDQDSGESFTYSVNDDRFEIVGGLLKLKADQSIDYNSEPSVDLQITVTDSGGIEYTETLTIKVGGIILDSKSFSENDAGASIGSLSVIGLDTTSSLTYSLSGEDARFFEINAEGVLKLKDGFQADYERDASYQFNITALNDAGDSLTTIMTVTVEDVAEAMEKASLHAWGKNYYRLAYDTIWLKDTNDIWYETSNQFYQIIKVPEKDSSDEIYLFTIDLVDPDGSATYNLIVKSVSGSDVSDLFRLDASTGAVYLKAGSSIEFETSTGHYHAGTGVLSYGHNGSDNPITDSVRPLVFSIEDDSGEQLVTWGDSAINNPLYVVLEFGDTSDDGSLEIGHTLEASEIYETWSYYWNGTIILSAGGKDITGDGIADAVFILHDEDYDYIEVYLVPGGNRFEDLQSGDFGFEIGVYLTSWPSFYDGSNQTPTDLDLGDVNGDGYADIVLGFGTDYFAGWDYDGDGDLDSTDGMVEIIHGASLATLIEQEGNQTWTSFLSPLGSRDANFGASIAVGDLNGDGYADIVIGAPYADENDALDNNDGAIYILYGQASLKINTYDDSGGGAYVASDYGNSIQYYENFSGFTDAEMGAAVTVGDFNGDGFVDYATSLNELTLNGLDDSGVVLIALGNSLGQPFIRVVIGGAAANAHLGEGDGSLENLGDLNGDGRDDLGIKDADGRFFIIWGQADADWPLDFDYDFNFVNDSYFLDLSLASSLDGIFASGDILEETFNFKGVGDIDGDGYDDFFIGTPFASWVSSYSGQEYGQGLLIYGQDSWLGEYDELNLRYVIIKGEYLGHQILALGDMDGDGRDEFAFSSGSTSGAEKIIPWWGNDRADNSAPDPKFALDNNTVLENQTGAIVGTLSGVNLQDGETINYSDVSITGDHADLFEISSSGELKLKDGITLNYENTAAINLTLSGYTSQGTTIWSQSFAINVVDVNDAPDFNLANYWVADQNTGALIGPIDTIDDDQFDEYTYALSGEDADAFEITANGELKLKDGVTPDFASKANYLLTITTTDAAGETSSQSISIAVNVAPTDLSLSANAVDESHYGLEVGSISVADPNTSDAFTYTLSGADKDFFEITTEGVLKLIDDVYADYEMQDSYSVTVTAIDQGGLSIEKSFSISVNDLNYATPYVSDIQDQWNVEESSNLLVNAMLFGCSLDPDGDASTPLTLTYSIANSSSFFPEDYRGIWSDSPHLDVADPSSEAEEAVDRAFQLFGQITGITFVKVTETTTQCGDIRIGITNMDVGYAGISFVDIYLENAYEKDSGGSDIWLSANSWDWGDGSWNFNVLLHEIGHSLGLKHPHNAFYPNNSGFNSPYMPLAYDAQYWTVMAYRDYVGDNAMGMGRPDSHQFTQVLGCAVCGISGDKFNTYGLQSMVTKDGDDIYPYTPMFLDILALRYLYAYNEQTQSYNIPDVNSGDDTYYITGPVDFTIFDTGGIDTIDFSTLDLDSTINLDDVLSYIGTDEINYDDGEFYTGFIVGIYWLNSPIENVNAGSGDDTITCNVAVNVIYCGPGSDTVNAIGIGDSVYGGAGNDLFIISDAGFTLIDGGGGNDTMSWEESTAVNGQELTLTTGGAC